MRISTIAFIFVLLALTACGGGGGTPQGTVATMFALINSLRTASGATALAANTQLATVAQAQATHNAVVHADSATDTDGKTIGERLTTAGVDFTTLAVPTGHGPEADVTSAWTDTQSERDILFDATLNSLGVGVATDGTTQRWVAVLAHVVP